MTGPHLDSEPRFSEEQVARIVRRAIAIDARMGTQISESTLHEIAAELEISRAAIARAIAEEQQRLAVPPPQRTHPAGWSRLRLTLFAGTSAAVGFVFGVLGRIAAQGPVRGDVNAETINLALVLGMAVVASAFLMSGRMKLPSFLLCNAGLWTGLVTGWSQVHGRVWDDIIAVGVMGAVLTSVLGIPILAWLHKRRPVLRAAE
ncbi:MAG: hypothetical protein ACRENP_04135 [Longimicrobiales bacterium]